MRIDVVDLVRADPGILQCPANGPRGAGTMTTTIGP